MGILISEESIVKNVSDKVTKNIEEKFEELEQSFGELGDRASLRDRCRELQDELNTARRELMEERNKTPTQQQIDQWGEGKKAVKKIQDVRKIAYSEGYAAAFIDTANRMMPGQPAQLKPGNQGY